MISGQSFLRMTIQDAKELDPKDDGFVPQMLDFMVENVPHEFHLRKAMEECFELGEVLAKTLNKREDNRPSRQRIIEESADLTIRILCILGELYKDDGAMTTEDAMANGSEALGEAIEEKLKKIQGWLKEGKLYNLKF